MQPAVPRRRPWDIHSIKPPIGQADVPPGHPSNVKLAPTVQPAATPTPPPPAHEGAPGAHLPASSPGAAPSPDLPPGPAPQRAPAPAHTQPRVDDPPDWPKCTLCAAPCSSPQPEHAAQHAAGVAAGEPACRRCRRVLELLELSHGTPAHLRAALREVGADAEDVRLLKAALQISHAAAAASRDASRAATPTRHTGAATTEAGPRACAGRSSGITARAVRAASAAAGPSSPGPEASPTGRPDGDVGGQGVSPTVPAAAAADRMVFCTVCKVHTCSLSAVRAGRRYCGRCNRIVQRVREVGSQGCNVKHVREAFVQLGSGASDTAIEKMAAEIASSARPRADGDVRELMQRHAARRSMQEGGPSRGRASAGGQAPGSPRSPQPAPTQCGAAAAASGGPRLGRSAGGPAVRQKLCPICLSRPRVHVGSGFRSCCRECDNMRGQLRRDGVAVGCADLLRAAHAELGPESPCGAVLQCARSWIDEAAVPGSGGSGDGGKDDAEARRPSGGHKQIPQIPLQAEAIPGSAQTVAHAEVEHPCPLCMIRPRRHTSGSGFCSYCPPCDRLRQRVWRSRGSCDMDVLRAALKRCGAGASDDEVVDHVKRLLARQGDGKPTGAAGGGGSGSLEKRKCIRVGDCRVGAAPGSPELGGRPSQARGGGRGRGSAGASTSAAPQNLCAVCSVRERRWTRAAGFQGYCPTCDNMRHRVKRVTGSSSIALLRAAYKEAGCDASFEVVAECVARLVKEQPQQRHGGAVPPGAACPAAALDADGRHDVDRPDGRGASPSCSDDVDSEDEEAPERSASPAGLQNPCCICQRAERQPSRWYCRPCAASQRRLKGVLGATSLLRAAFTELGKCATHEAVEQRAVAMSERGKARVKGKGSQGAGGARRSAGVPPRAPCAVCCSSERSEGHSYCARCNRVRRRLDRGPGVVRALRDAIGELGASARFDALSARVRELMHEEVVGGTERAGGTSAPACSGSDESMSGVAASDESADNDSADHESEEDVLEEEGIPVPVEGTAKNVGAQDEGVATGAPDRQRTRMDVAKRTPQQAQQAQQVPRRVSGQQQRVLGAAGAGPDAEPEAGSSVCCVLRGMPVELSKKEVWRADLSQLSLAVLHRNVSRIVEGQQYVYCADVSAGAERFPIPAVIDDPAGLRASGAAPPPIFPQGFTYTTDPGQLRMTPAARRFLDTVFPVTKPADMWAGCQHTHTSGGLTSLSRPGGVSLDANLRLKAWNNHTPLVECEPGCSCPLQSVTARGAFLPLQLFLHQNPDGSPSPVGWGVRCAVDIAAGTFLAAYTGIVAVNSEVPPRSRYTVSLDHFLDAVSTLAVDPAGLRSMHLQRFPVIPVTTLPRAYRRQQLIDYGRVSFAELGTWRFNGLAPSPSPLLQPPRSTDAIALQPPAAPGSAAQPSLLTKETPTAPPSGCEAAAAVELTPTHPPVFPRTPARDSAQQAAVSGAALGSAAADVHATHARLSERGAQAMPQGAAVCSATACSAQPGTPQRAQSDDQGDEATVWHPPWRQPCLSAARLVPAPSTQHGTTAAAGAPAEGLAAGISAGVLGAEHAVRAEAAAGGPTEEPRAAPGVCSTPLHSGDGVRCGGPEQAVRDTIGGSDSAAPQRGAGGDGRVQTTSPRVDSPNSGPGARTGEDLSVEGGSSRGRVGAEDLKDLRRLRHNMLCLSRRGAQQVPPTLWDSIAGSRVFRAVGHGRCRAANVQLDADAACAAHAAPSTLAPIAATTAAALPGGAVADAVKEEAPHCAPAPHAALASSTSKKARSTPKGTCKGGRSARTPCAREMVALMADAADLLPADGEPAAKRRRVALHAKSDSPGACRWAPYRWRSELPKPQDLPGDEEHLVIDGQTAGCVSRFFNHSCAPNVACQNVLLPGAGAAVLYGFAFFAEGNIPAMTELRWNYYGATLGPVQHGSVPCRCGSTPCRKWLY